MKKIAVVAVVLVALLGAHLFSASDAAAAKVETAQGTRALVFQFSGLSSLGAGAYQGGIGMRYYMQDGLALRPGVVFDMLSSTEKAPVSGFTDDKESATVVGINLAIEKHAAGMGSLSPYLGADAGFSMSNVKEEPSVSSSPVNGTVLKSTTKGTAFGVGLLAGFEWGFSEGVTLGAEYKLSATFGSSKEETEIKGLPTVTTDDISGSMIGFGTASFFLSVAW